MSIRVIDREEVDNGERSIELIEVVDDDTNEESVGWQFVCELCEEFRTGLTEKEARHALAHHSCQVLQDYG